MEEKLPHSSIPNVQIFEAPSRGFKRLAQDWIFSSKLIYLILVIVILLELYLGLKTLLTPIPSVPKLAQISEGAVILETERESYSLGEKIPVNIKISTGGYNTVGTDLIIKFDPNFFRAETDAFFEKGTTYSDYPGTSIDIKNGVILLSGIILSDTGGFNGTGGFGILNLQAKKTGESELKVDFETGSTTDSNIIEITGAKDILGKVYNLKVKVGDKGEVKRIDESNSCGGYTQLCWDNQGKQGTQECLGGALKDQTCVFDPYLTDSCSICGLGQKIEP